jgi:hypothetical protein
MFGMGNMGGYMIYYKRLGNVGTFENTKNRKEKKKRIEIDMGEN